MAENYNNIIETLDVIYAASGGKLKVFLTRKKDDPYKGYWILPGEFLKNDETLDDKAMEIYQKTTSLSNGKISQSKIFSDLNRYPDRRIIAQSYFSITDERLVTIKNENEESAWFDTDELPKLAYDHEAIILAVTKEVKTKIINNTDDILLDFFPNDFTLPELQKFYETVMGKKMDRRNFYKKFVSQDLVLDTGVKTTGSSGRPGVLYRFNVEKMRGKRV